MKTYRKIDNLLNVILHFLRAGQFLDTRHAKHRKANREITRAETFHVLELGYHEKRKDKYNTRYQTWNYAIRGKTPDERELRIIISFNKSMMLIITAIDLSRKGR